jgi:hypothetical protein
MGFFSKKRPSDVDREQRAANEPFIADDQTMARVAELMRMFNNTVDDPNPADTYAIGKGISSAAGLHSLEQMLGQMQREKTRAEVWFERPWKMLAAVALRAAEDGDHVLVARIFGFTYAWGALIAPDMGLGDVAEVLLTASPPAIETQIAALALRSLLHFPVDQVIVGTSTASVTAEQLTLTAATVLVDASEKGIPVNGVVLAAAKSRVGLDPFGGN